MTESERKRIPDLRGREAKGTSTKLFSFSPSAPLACGRTGGCSPSSLAVVSTRMSPAVQIKPSEGQNGRVPLLIEDHLYPAPCCTGRKKPDSSRIPHAEPIVHAEQSLHEGILSGVIGHESTC